MDLRLEKSFRLTERRAFTLTADAFNAFNHTNITSVNTTIYGISGTNLQFQDGQGNRALFGLPTQSSNSLLAQRQIQIGARLDF